MSARSGSGGGKWELPGWRIEQKYCQGVLIGNWSEDRLGKFHKGDEFGNSTSREAFMSYLPSAYQPDSSIRRKGLFRSGGLGPAHIFGHHGNRYMHNNISTYDQQFSKRHSTGEQTQRQWDRHRLSWLPEASDNPATGSPTRFGLREAIEEKWRRLKEIESHGDYCSTYTTSFRSLPQGEGSQVHRHATPRHLSSHLHPHRGNAHLVLRGMPHLTSPETVSSHLLHPLTV